MIAGNCRIHYHGDMHQQTPTVIPHGLHPDGGHMLLLCERLKSNSSLVSLSMLPKERCGLSE